MKEGVPILNYKSSNSEYLIKHVLSTEWIIAKYISDNDDYIEFLIEDSNTVSFEKDDKIIYSIKSKNKNCTFNTVVSDIDFPTYDKITITVKKPFERRVYSRYNVNLSSTILKNGVSTDSIVVDISKNGFKIITNSDLDLKQTISMTVFIDDNVSLLVKCSVIYKQPNFDYSNQYKYMYGLKISEISNIDKSLLNDFISSLR